MTRILDRPVPVEPYWRRVPGAEPLLQAIALNPDDDATHLVLADLCDDCGEHARAEFIRLSVDPVRIGLTRDNARAAEMLATHGDVWGERLPKIAGLDWHAPERFVRGLLCAVSFNSVPADTDARAILRAIDVRSIRLGPVEEPVNSGIYTMLRQAVDFTFIDCNWVGDDYRDCFAAMAAGNARSLSIEHVMDDESLIDALASTAAQRSLTDFDMSSTFLTADATAALLSAPLLRRLRRLTLWGCDLDPEAVRLIAAWDGCRSLVALNLGWSRLFDDGAKALAASANLANLRELRLPDCRIGVSGTLALARSEALSAVETLQLSDSRLGPEAIAALGKRLFDGDTLDLCAAWCRDAGVAALLAVWGDRHCRQLNLTNCGLTATGIAALVKHPRLASVEELRLGYNPIGDDGARLLASSPYLGSLRELAVARCDLTGVGVAALLASPNLIRLERLSARDRELTSDDIRAIAAVPCPPRLASLWLRADRAAEDAVAELRAAFGGVTDLSVQFPRP